MASLTKVTKTSETSAVSLSADLLRSDAAGLAPRFFAPVLPTQSPALAARALPTPSPSSSSPSEDERADRSSPSDSPGSESEDARTALKKAFDEIPDRSLTEAFVEFLIEHLIENAADMDESEPMRPITCLSKGQKIEIGKIYTTPTNERVFVYWRGKIGNGSCKRVYHGIDISKGKHVAIAICDPREESKKASQAWLREQIGREIQYAAFFSCHERVTQTHYIIQDGDITIFVMEYYDRNACKIINSMMDNVDERSPPSLAECAALGLKIAAAVQVVHDHDVVHGDVKPEQFLERIESGEIAITDFGCASPKDTKNRDLCGSPEYIAPEVIAAAPADRCMTIASDVWSLGVILFNAMTLASAASSDEAFLPWQNLDSFEKLVWTLQQLPDHWRPRSPKGTRLAVGALLRGALDRNSETRWPIGRIVKQLKLIHKVAFADQEVLKVASDGYDADDEA